MKEAGSEALTHLCHHSSNSVSCQSRGLSHGLTSAILPSTTTPVCRLSSWPGYSYCRKHQPKALVGSCAINIHDHPLHAIRTPLSPANTSITSKRPCMRPRRYCLYVERGTGSKSLSKQSALEPSRSSLLFPKLEKQRHTTTTQRRSSSYFAIVTQPCVSCCYSTAA